MSDAEREPSKWEQIREKSRLLMGVLCAKHTVQPEFDPKYPYRVFDETVLEPIEAPEFRGIVMHNVYYDSGVNPGEDPGPREKLVVAGVRGQSMVNFTTSNDVGLAYTGELVGPRADDILTALNASLSALGSPEAQ